MATAVCPSRETLFQYSIGILNGQQRDDLDEHLDSCSDCQATIMTLDDTDDTVVGRLRMPSNDSFMDEPQLQAALKAAMELPLRRKGPFSPSGQPVEIPKTLGEYQVLEELGRGGMGRVYKARHTKLNRVVAVKLLARPKLGDPQAISRFEREMQAIGLLDHPNIVQAYDAREIDDMPVLIMEFIDGLDLAELVRRVGPLPVADACELIRRTAIALQYAHEHGLVHRDIKPSNIMLAKIGEVKLLDLGLARFYVETVVGEEMTGSGQAMGTADYMAPEQATDSRRVDIRADIYSLGCTIYKLLSGRAPFASPEYRGTLDKMNAHVHETPVPICQFVPDLPEELAKIVERMIAKEPGDRFSTPAEVAAALEPFCVNAKGQAANLPELITRAIALPREQWAKAEKSHDANFITPRPATSPNRRRPTAKYLLLGLGFLGAIVLSFGAGVIITIKKDGQTYQIAPSPNTRTSIDEHGNPTIEDLETSEKGASPATSGEAGHDRFAHHPMPHDATLKVFAIVHADAASLVKVVERLLPESGQTAEIKELRGKKLLMKPVNFAVDPRTNNIVATGDRETLDIVEALLLRLDSSSAHPSNVTTANASRTLPSRPAVNAAAELKALQGDWKTVQQENGESTDPMWLSYFNAAKISRLIFQNQYVVLVNFEIGAEANLSYRIDPTTTPKSIDMLEQGENGQLAAVGIYEFDGDKLKICLTKYQPSLKNNQRPTGFSLAPKSGDTLLTLERYRPSEDEKTLQGGWTIISQTENGKAIAEEQLRAFNWRFDVYSVGISKNDPMGTLVCSGPLLLEENKEPKKMTIFAHELDNNLGYKKIQLYSIYKLDGDRLTIASRKGGPAPDKFESTPGSGVTLLELKRSEPKPATGISPSPEGLSEGPKKESAKLNPAAEPTVVATSPSTAVVSVRDELRTFNGAWKVEKIENKINVNSPIYWLYEKAERFVFDAEGFDVEDFMANKYDYCRYRIDPSTNPKSIDVSRWDGKKQSLQFVGIYEIDADRLTIRLARFLQDYQPNDLRPKSFTLEPDSEDSMITLHRLHPTADEKALSGKWKIVSVDEDGKRLESPFKMEVPEKESPEKTTREFYLPTEVFFRTVSNRCFFDFNIRSMRAEKLSHYQLDSSQEPKQITFFTRSKKLTLATEEEYGRPVGEPPLIPDLKEYHGIFKLDGDRLTIAYRKNGPAPDKFESTPGSGVTLLELKRSEPKPADNAAPPPSASSPYNLPPAKPAEKPAATPAQTVTPAADLKALQGTWKVVRQENGLAADTLWLDRFHAGKLDRLLFEQGYLSLLNIGDEENAQSLLFRLDPTAGPKKIDILEQGPKGGRPAALGIYRFQGKQLQVCLAKYQPSLLSDQRPKSFAFNPQSGDILLTLERYQPSADEKRMAGQWQVVREIVDGKPFAPGRTCNFSNFYVMHEFNWRGGTTGDGYHYTPYAPFLLDETRNPKRISILSWELLPSGQSKEVKFSGIYQFDNERLTIAYRKNGPAPDKFESTPGSGVTLLELKRSEPKPATDAVPAPDDSKAENEPKEKAADKPNTPPEQSTPPANKPEESK